MTSQRDTVPADAWMLDIEESISNLRERLTNYGQDADRDRRELNAMQERVRETEELAIRAVAQASAVSGRLDEIQTLRERLGRFQSTIDGQSEQIEVTLRQIRHELDMDRAALGAATRRLDTAELADSEANGRLIAVDEAIRRLSDESGELTRLITQTDTHVKSSDARIAANTEAVRRAHTEQRAADSLQESFDRRLGELAERLNVVQQSLRQIGETSEQWDAVAATVEAMRTRAEESRRQMDQAVAVAASVQRSFETFEERIGDIERAAEQLRVQDSQRARALNGLGDQLEHISGEIAREQQRFVALQEQIRRRQITDLEQEIRELKAYARVQSDD